MSENKEIVNIKNKVSFSSEADLKQVLATQYQKQINNFFGDEKKALKFLSSVVAEVQRNPKILECTPVSVINAFMKIAELQFMPSGVSGEAYVIPYGKEAQFQLGYQGLVTLFYRAGVRSINSEIVYENDKFTVANGMPLHQYDVFTKDRGEAKGAYVIIELQAGGKVYKVMSKDEIMDIAQKFSKTFTTKFSPWNPVNDPQRWMWKKTVLKQAAKLVPKNETIYKAIAEDNKESNIAERVETAKEDIKALSMGSLVKNEQETKDKKSEAKQDVDTSGSPEDVEWENIGG